MIMPGTEIQVLVATKPVDFRKQADGLAAIVRKRCPDPTFRSGSGGGLMPAHERSI